MAVRMRVDEVPALADGSGARVCVGQVNGGDSQLVRLSWEDGTLYWVNGRNEAQAKDATYRILDAEGRAPDVALGEAFTYRIEVEDGRVTVIVEAGGATYSSAIAIGPGWDDNSFYFKAGLYLATNEANSTGEGQVSIYGIDVTHDGTDPVLDDVAPPPPQAPAAISDHGVEATLAGTAGDDLFEVGHRRTEVRAGSGFDTVRASVNWEMQGGEERLELTGSAALKGEGSGRADQIVGNAGANALDGDDHLQGGGGADTLRGQDDDDRLEGGRRRRPAGGRAGRRPPHRGRGGRRLRLPLGP